ncbi:MAG: hypothetical protein ACTS68_02190 [Candidatus Hodgkinia cicadicola]
MMKLNETFQVSWNQINARSALVSLGNETNDVNRFDRTEDLVSLEHGTVKFGNTTGGSEAT